MDSQRWLATEQKTIPSGVYSDGNAWGFQRRNENLSRTKQGQNEPYGPVLGSGRPQSEISLKQKEGYG